MQSWFGNGGWLRADRFTSSAEKNSPLRLCYALDFVCRWANDDHLQRPGNSSRPLDTTWGSRDAEPDDTLGDVGAARKRGELTKSRL